MPTLSELEEWIEEQIPRNLHDLPSKLHETLSIYYESLYHELTRYGSPLPSISLPDLSSLGLPTLSQIEQTLPFNTNCTSSPSVQAPPPPVGFIQKTSNHLSNHSGKYLTTSLTIGLGLTLWYAYGRGFNNSRSLKGKGRESNVAHSNGYWFDWKGLNRKRKARVERGLRREAVVVLGADTPLGRSLALSLSSSSNLIVLCTISTPTSFNSFEALIPPSSRGYVKALLLDSSDPVTSIPTFIRDVKAALGLRWPSTIAGDPYARKGEEISLIGVVNCLSYLPEIETNHSLGIEEDQDLELNPTDLTQLLDSHVTTPLSVISSLLPFLKTPTSSYLKSLNLNNNYVGGNNNNRVEFELSPTSTILNILPLLNLKVSLPGKMRESIIAKSVQSGMEVLKRENEAVESNQLYRGAEDDDDDDLVRFGRRNVRFTTLTLSSGNAFSFGLGNGSPSTQKQNPNVSNSNPTINSDPTTSSSSNLNTSRPGLNQSRSSLNLSSTWSSRDSHTQSLMEKVSSILLKRSCYKLPTLQNLHLGFEKSLIHGRTSISNSNSNLHGRKREKEIFTQAQITQTSHASSNTFIKRSLSRLNSRLAIFKAYSYSIFGSLRNSTLHYLSAFSHFLIQDLSEDVLDFIITLSLRNNKRRIREKENNNVTPSSSSSTGYRYNHHRRSTIKQGQSQSHSQLTTPSTGNSGLGSSPLHSAPRTDSNPTSSTKSGTSSIASEEAEMEMSGPGSSGSEAEVEDGYDIHSLPDSNNGSGNSQMTNSVEFDSNPSSNQRSSQILSGGGSGENSSNSDSATQGQGDGLNSSGERDDLNKSQHSESGGEGSVMGESWVRLSESENGREE